MVISRRNTGWGLLCLTPVKKPDSNCLSCPTCKQPLKHAVSEISAVLILADKVNFIYFTFTQRCIYPAQFNKILQGRENSQLSKLCQFRWNVYFTQDHISPFPLAGDRNIPYNFAVRLSVILNHTCGFRHTVRMTNIWRFKSLMFVLLILYRDVLWVYYFVFRVIDVHHTVRLFHRSMQPF